MEKGEAKPTTTGPSRAEQLGMKPASSAAANKPAMTRAEQLGMSSSSKPTPSRSEQLGGGYGKRIREPEKPTTTDVWGSSTGT